ncbi:MAG: hypothetical protein AAF717_20955 [Bacteroidota bacterium]
MRRFLVGGILLAVVLSCGGDDDAPAPIPGEAILVFPEQNSECTTGIDVSSTLSQVTFEWQPSENTNSYTLTVINLFTNVPQTTATSGTNAALTIEKGTPFSWSVQSSNNRSNETATSASWLFYNAGSQTTYPPFPAQLVAPGSGATVQKNVDNEIVLQWVGADVEDDIAIYEVYFSDQNPPETLLITTLSDSQQTSVAVSSGIYYWKVVTIDEAGNQSDSGVFDFRVF